MQHDYFRSTLAIVSVVHSFWMLIIVHCMDISQLSTRLRWTFVSLILEILEIKLSFDINRIRCIPGKGRVFSSQMRGC